MSPVNGVLNSFRFGAGQQTTVYEYQGVGGGPIYSNAETYADARAGTGSKFPFNAGFIGQWFDPGDYYNPATYTCFQWLMTFDTTTLPGSSVVSAQLELYFETDFSTDADFDVEVRQHDYGATFEVADYVPGASLASKTLLCSKSTVGLSTSAYTVMTEAGTALKDAISFSTPLRTLVSSSRIRTNNAPAGLGEYITTYHSTAGKYPKLTVVTM